jgi:glucan phosphorylase
MKFPRAADDLYKLRCERKTNGIEPKRNSEVTSVGFTNKITKKKVWIQITQTRQNTRYKKERETVKQRRDVISLPKKCCGLER